MRVNKKTFFQSGQVSRLLLVLAVVVFVAVVITYLVLRMAERPDPGPTPEPEVTLPIYEKQLGDINFNFEYALNKGQDLTLAQIINKQYSNLGQKALHTDEKFIEVKVGAVNKGSEDIERGAWTLGKIVDSEGRRFAPLETYSVAPWLPTTDLCGALLKPAFSPTPCIRIYEVSKQSTGLKITIITGKDNLPNNLSSDKTSTFLLDMIVK